MNMVLRIEKNQGVYRLDALDHYSADSRSKGKVGEVGEVVKPPDINYVFILVLPTLLLVVAVITGVEKMIEIVEPITFTQLLPICLERPEGERPPRDTEED